MTQAGPLPEFAPEPKPALGQRGRDGGWALINTLSSLLSALATFTIVARTLGTAELGLLALVTAALFPLRFAELGVSGVVTRYVGAQRSGPFKAYLWQVVGLAWAISLCALVALMAACGLFSPPLLRTTIAASLQDRAWHLVPLVAGQTVLQLGAGPLLSAVLGLKRFRLAYLTGTILSLAQIAAVFPLTAAFGIAGLVLSQAGVQLASAAIFATALTAMPERGPIDGALPPRLDRPAFLHFTLQFSFNSLITTLLEPAAKLMIGAQAPLAVVGLYEVMWRVLVQLRTVLVAPFNPLGIAMIGEWQHDRHALDRSYQLMTLLALGGAVGILLAIVPVFGGVALVLGKSGGDALLVAGGIACALAVAFLAVPSHFLCLAANDMRPVIYATLANLAVLLGVGSAIGLVLGWRWQLAVLAGAYAAGAALQMLVAAKRLDYRTVPPLTALARSANELGGRIGQLLGLQR